MTLYGGINRIPSHWEVWEAIWDEKQGGWGVIYCDHSAPYEDEVNAMLWIPKEEIRHMWE